MNKLIITNSTSDGNTSLHIPNAVEEIYDETTMEFEDVEALESYICEDFKDSSDLEEDTYLVYGVIAEYKVSRVIVEKVTCSPIKAWHPSSDADKNVAKMTTYAAETVEEDIQVEANVAYEDIPSFTDSSDSTEDSMPLSFVNNDE